MGVGAETEVQLRPRPTGLCVCSAATPQIGRGYEWSPWRSDHRQLASLASIQPVKECTASGCDRKAVR